jgi:glycerol kinase
VLLALDLGTTSTRALVLEPGGAVRGRAVRGLATRFPAPGRVEQDPEQWLVATLEAAREALSCAACGASDLRGVGLVTQRATAVAWDAHSGRALAPAIGWQDQRTHARVADLAAAGVPITTLPSATKFEWLLHNVPEVAQAAREERLCLGTPDAWLGFRLSGGACFATDPGQASCTALYDASAGDWSASALGLFGLERAALPEIARTSGALAQVDAALPGIAAPLAARAGDQQAACFAQGATSQGDAKLTLGTSAMLDVNTGHAPAPPPRGAYPLSLWRLRDEPEAFCLEGTVVTAGAAIDWLVEIGLLRDVTALDALAGSVASSDGVVFVPALQGLGTPWLDDAARGFFGGLTRGSGAAHLVRAALEGVAQRCADLCDALSPGAVALRVDGGLSRSDLLLQRIADLSGLTVERALESEATAVGAALLAAHGAGLLSRADDVRDWLPPARTFTARATAQERLAARERWRDGVARAAGRPSLR